MVDYWFATTYGCGLVRVIDGKVASQGTIPIYQWMKEKNLYSIISFLKKKKQFVGMEQLKDN